MREYIAIDDKALRKSKFQKRWGAREVENNQRRSFVIKNKSAPLATLKNYQITASYYEKTDALCLSPIFSDDALLQKTISNLPFDKVHSEASAVNTYVLLKPFVAGYRDLSIDDYSETARPPR